MTSHLRRHGHKVVEAGRADRRSRRANGKSDTLDAENAARLVLAGFVTAVPKTADGSVEMIRQPKIAHESAVTDRTAATSSERSTTSSKRTPQQEKSGVDNYRSVNALAETVKGYYKTELVRGPARSGPWKTVEDLELATLGWVHWHNTQRLHGYLGDIPPAEFEEEFYADQTAAGRLLGIK